MWPGYPNPGASFFTDDPDNQKTAEDYGICISKEKITEFFDEGIRRAEGCESYVTLGMRGEYDKKMVTDDPAAVVRDVIRTQRGIIKDVHGREDGVTREFYSGVKIGYLTADLGFRTSRAVQRSARPV